MQYTWQLALVLVPVYFIKHSVSCMLYLLHIIMLIIAHIRTHRLQRHPQTHGSTTRGRSSQIQLTIAAPDSTHGKTTMELSETTN